MNKLTTDHDTIRKWMEDGDGQPARIKSTGILTVDFGKADADITLMDWEDFFDAFDKDDLAFVYEERVAGAKGNFCEFINRETESVEDEEDDADISDFEKAIKDEGKAQAEEEGNLDAGEAIQ